MNKKLMALAVAGACVAPTVMAQTASPVTLYGRVYVTVESVKTKGGSGALPSRMRVSDHASLLGVRGTEDLGGGLKAFFQLETGFAPDANMTSFATRNSGIGLQGSWGSIMAGRWDMPFKSATIAIDPYGDLTIGGITSAMNDKGNFDRREQNVMQYWSPNMGGFAVRLAMTANEGKTATLNPRNSGASLTYGKGPVYLYYAYEEHKDVSATLRKEEGNAIGGSFTMGAFKVGAAVQEYKKTGMTKQKAWMANVVWTMGKHQLSFQHQDSKDGGASGAAVQPECDNNAFGWQYNWTKRTFMLAQYSKTDNNEAATCRIGSFVGPAGSDPEGFSLGVRHVF